MKRFLIGLTLILSMTHSQVSAVDFTLITDLGTSAEMIGIGNVEGFSRSHSVFENPAGLTRIDNVSFGFFATRLLEEVTYKNASIGYATKYGNLGLGYMEGTVDGLEDTFLNPTTGRFGVGGLFSYKDRIVKASYQVSPARNVSLGASYVRYQRGSKDISGDGWNLETGLLYRIHNSEVSVLARNILSGRDVEFSDGGSENLPFQLVVSGKQKVVDFDILGQIKRTKGRSFFSGGVVYHPSFVPILSISGGFKEFFTIDGRVRNNFTIGIGLQLNGLQYWYAFEKSDHPTFDNKSYFSITIDL